MLHKIDLEIEFKQEMKRFLAGEQLNRVTNQHYWWHVILNVMEDFWEADTSECARIAFLSKG